MKTRHHRAFYDLVTLVTISALTLYASLRIDPFARAVAWIYHFDNWMLDEFFTLVLVLMVGMTVYSWRRWRELKEENRHRETAQEHARELAVALESTRREVLALQGILRICEVCQRIQDGSNTWITLERYMQAHSNANVSHELCPRCAGKVHGSDMRTARSDGTQAEHQSRAQ